MSALATTGADLARALAQASASPAVARTVRARAERLGREVETRAAQEGQLVTVRVNPRGPTDVIVDISAPGLFARVFGSLSAPVDAASTGALRDLQDQTRP
jgi:hypothetical protein